MEGLEDSVDPAAPRPAAGGEGMGERARLGKLLLAMTIGDVFVALGSTLDPRNDLGITAAVHLPVLILFGASAWGLRRGYVRQVGWVISWVLWGLVTASILLFGGLTGGANVVGYVLVVIIAGATIDPRAAWPFAWVSILVVSVVLGLETAGRLPPPLIPYSPFNAWLGIVTVTLLVAYLHRSVVDALARALARSRQTMARLRQVSATNERRARQGEELGRLGARLQEIRDEASFWPELLATVEAAWPEFSPRLWIARGGSTGTDATYELFPGEDDRVSTVTREALREPGREVAVWRVSSPAAGRLCEIRGGGNVWIARIGAARAPAAYLAMCVPEGASLEDDEELLLGTLADLASTALARIEAERRAVQAQKLEVIGRLAGGVAHDFNNLLTAIMAIAEDLRAEVGPGRRGRDALDTLDAVTERAALVTNQLLAVSRRRLAQEGRVDMARVVRDLIPMLERLLPDEIIVEARVPEDPVWVRVDRGSLEQLILNLAINAAEAIDHDHGRVDLEVHVGPERGRLCVRDNGVGLEPTVRERLFEPFFTTKRDGTGLGLSIVRDVVERTGGHAQVESTPGRGTEFSIELPYAVSAVGGGAPGAPTRAGRERLAARILVVEDHDLVRRGIVRMLTREGLEVRDVASGEQALRALAEGPFDLVLTDMHMPGGTGEALARDPAIVARGLPVLITSGDATLSLPREPGHPPRAFLSKPFSRQELLDTLFDLLRQARAAPARRHVP